MSKDLNPGKAAASGILAALLARQGFTGSPTALENGKGFVHTHADESDLTRITAGLGNSYRIDEIAFKPWACCRHNHAAIEALLRICKTHAPAADTIGEIEVSLYPAAIWLVDDPDPFTKGFYGTRYSVQFNLALAFITGETGMERALIDQPYVESMLKEARVQELMKKVSVKLDPDLAKDWPHKWPARVKISLSNGQSFDQTIEYPLGEPEHPMAYAKLIDKFKRASQGYLSEAEAQTVAQMVENFDRENDMKAFFRAVSGMHGAGEKA